MNRTHLGTVLKGAQRWPPHSHYWDGPDTQVAAEQNSWSVKTQNKGSEKEVLITECHSRIWESRPSIWVPDSTMRYSKEEHGTLCRLTLTDSCKSCWVTMIKNYEKKTCHKVTLGMQWCRASLTPELPIIRRQFLKTRTTSQLVWIRSCTVSDSNFPFLQGSNKPKRL